MTKKKARSQEARKPVSAPKRKPVRRPAAKKPAKKEKKPKKRVAKPIAKKRSMPKHKRPAKKRKSAKRSKAAKLGWIRRRQAAELIEPDTFEDELTPEEKIRFRNHLVEKLAKMGRYRMSGRKAKFPSILRHMPDADDIYERLRTAGQEIDSGGYVNSLGDVDSDEFRSVALDIADEYTVPLREVYTLFLSP